MPGMIMRKNKNENIIWKDRKRHLGLPLSFTRYRLSEDRLFLSVGFATIRDEEILLYRIRDITCTRTLWQRLFGVGTVTIHSSDKTNPVLNLQNIKRPLETKETIHRYVETMKSKRRMRVSEVLAEDAGDDDDYLDDEEGEDYDEI